MRNGRSAKYSIGMNATPKREATSTIVVDLVAMPAFSGDIVSKDALKLRLNCRPLGDMVGNVFDEATNNVKSMIVEKNVHLRTIQFFQFGYKSLRIPIT